MVKGKFYSGQDDLTEIKEIRKIVFCDALHIAPEVEDDGQDMFCMHVLALDGDTPAATGRISFDGWDFVISKVAVLPEYQGKKFGDFVVRMLVDKAMMSNATKVQLDSFEDTVAFFETIGFKAEKEAGMLGDKKLISMILNTDEIHKCCNCKH